MKASDIPTKFVLPFASSAGAGFIRTVPLASQIGIQAGAASLVDGFPPVCFLPVGAGGTPPFGQDMNGILNQVSAWSRWQGASGPVAYDATFSAAIAGYPKGTVVASATTFASFWLSTADDNTSNPDSGGAGWIAFPSAGNARVVTASGVFALGLTDKSVGLNRTAGLAVSSSTLPSGAQNGQEIWIEDLASNFFAANVTIAKSADSASVAGLPAFVLNQNRQCVRFKFYSTGTIWSVKS